VLSICIAIGLPAVGLMGYSMTLARDRERGVFQRLRAAPIPTWAIMVSRIAVQLLVMAAMTLATCLFAYVVDKISIPPLNLIFVVLAGLVGGLSFLALGQFVVAFVLSTEAVNSAVRLIYFPIAIVGGLGQIGLFGELVQKIVTYSPLGTTKTMLAAAMNLSSIDYSHVLLAFVVTLAYALVFAGIGIRNFKWASQ
jgi:ABC-2 type transport system permease protein